MKEDKVIPPCIDGGFVCMPQSEFYELLEKQAQKGAEAALNSPEIKDIKELLGAFRSAKSTIWRTFWRVLTTSVLAIIMTGLAFKIKEGL